MQKKSDLISFVQTLGIILVVVGHSFHAYGNDIFWHKWIYSFHMPLFMCVSGYLLHYSLAAKGQILDNQTIGWKLKYLVRKIKRLLLPYVAISTLAYFPKFLLNRYSARPVDLSLRGYIDMLIYPWDNVIVFFWFLPTLFLIFVIFLFGHEIFKLIQRGRVVWVMILMVLLHLLNPLEHIRFLNISGVVSYLMYFALGYYMSKLHVVKVLSGRSKPFMLGSFVISVIFIYVPAFFAKDILMAVNGIIMCFCLGLICTNAGVKLLNPLFGASFTIYLYSWFPQVVCQQILLSVFPQTPPLVSMILAVSTVILIPWLIYKLILKVKRQSVYGNCLAIISGL